MSNEPSLPPKLPKYSSAFAVIETQLKFVPAVWPTSPLAKMVSPSVPSSSGSVRSPPRRPSIRVIVATLDLLSGSLGSVKFSISNLSFCPSPSVSVLLGSLLCSLTSASSVRPSPSESSSFGLVR